VARDKQQACWVRQAADVSTPAGRRLTAGA
jgi:hypothetical protein